MTVNQTFRGVGCLRAGGRWALVGTWAAVSWAAVSWAALLAACSGSVELTDVDEARAARARGETPAAAPAAPATPAAQSPTRTPAPAAAPAANPAPAAAPAASTPAAAPAGGGDVSFAADVWPIFSGKCAPCHTTANFGNQNIGNADKAAALADAKRIEDKIVMDLSGGRMPPGCGGPPGSAASCVSAADFGLIQDWFMADTPP